MSGNLERAYRNELSRALEQFQFIKETLRMCIFSVVKIARLELSPLFPVKYKSEDISKLSLGTLVSVFSKINNDTELHEALRKITKDRNNVVHRALLFTIGESQDENHMAEETRKMEEILARATEIHNRVLDVHYGLVRSLSELKRSRGKTHS